jgi:hypothetical protein
VTAPPVAPRSRFAIHALVFGAVALAAASQAAFAGPPRFALDDPYITLHNARALVAGMDANFPGVSPLVGTTSAVHMVVTAWLTRVLGDTWPLFVVGWFAIALYASGLVALANALRLGRRDAVAIVVLGLVVARTPLQLVNGLETGLAMAVALWMIVLALDDSSRSRVLAAHLGGLAPFVRPELGVLTVMLAIVRWRAIAIDASKPSRLVRRAIVVDATRIAITAAPWLLAYRIGTGHFFAQTTIAKMNWFAPSCRSYTVHFRLFFAASEDFLLSAGPLHLGIFGLAYGAVGRAALAYLVIVLASYLWLFPTGLNHNDGRYVYVLVPALLYGVAALVANARRDLQRIGRGIEVAMILFTLALLPARVAEFRAHRARAAENDEAARFLRTSIPSGARVLLHDVGLASVATSLRLIDMVGLKSPDAAQVHARLTRPSCGSRRQEAIESIARVNHVTHLVTVADWDRLYGIREALTTRGWQLRPMRESADGYSVYELTAP